MADISPEESYDILFGDPAPEPEKVITEEQEEEPEEADELEETDEDESEDDEEEEEPEKPASKSKESALIQEVRKERAIRQRMQSEIEQLKAQIANPQEVYPEGSEQARLVRLERRLADQDAAAEYADKSRAVEAFPELAENDDYGLAVLGLYESKRYPTWEAAAKAFKAMVAKEPAARKAVPSTAAARGTGISLSKEQRLMRELKSTNSESRKREIGADILGL